MSYKNGVKTFNENGVKDQRSDKQTVRLRNPHLTLLKDDYLYHLALGSGTDNLQEMFGDVKFVCMGGTPKRMETFANYMVGVLGVKLPAGQKLYDITQPSLRYAMYKAGPVLSVNHGMGAPSLGILLHEVTKLMYYAKAKNPIFIRIGTCGGIDLEPGTVVVSNGAVDGLLRNIHEMFILAERVERPAVLDQQLAVDIHAMSRADDNFKSVLGITMCADDFYEGQGRLDGAFCNYGTEDKMKYLRKLRDAGIVNIEMECTAFSAFTKYAGVKAAIINVTLLNRLHGDQVETPKEALAEWQNRPQILIGRYIKQWCENNV